VIIFNVDNDSNKSLRAYQLIHLVVKKFKRNFNASDQTFRLLKEQSHVHKGEKPLIFNCCVMTAIKSFHINQV
jgi:hypothetical protein